MSRYEDDYDYDEMDEEELQEEIASIGEPDGGILVGGKLIKEFTSYKDLEEDAKGGPKFSKKELEELDDLHDRIDDVDFRNGYVALTTTVATLVTGGYTNAKIKRETGMSAKELSAIKNSELFAEIMSSLTSRIVDSSKSLMAVATMKATVKMISLIDSKNEKVALAASKEVLDRVGVKQLGQIQNVHNGDNIVINTGEAYESLMYGLEEIKKSYNSTREVIDVEVGESTETKGT